MTQEEKEEFKPAEESVDDPEHAPAESESPPENPPAEPTVEPVVEPVAEPEKDKPSYEELEAENAKLQENYRNVEQGLMTEKGRNRRKELDLEIPKPEEDSLEEIPPTTANAEWDFQSKYSDAKADNDNKLAKLTDGEFAVVKEQLQLKSATMLAQIKKTGKPIGRKLISDMFEDAFSYADFKTNRKGQPINPPEDFGSTRTIRKVKTPIKISDRARSISNTTRNKKTGQIEVSPERVQEMLDKGEL